MEKDIKNTWRIFLMNYIQELTLFSSLVLIVIIMWLRSSAFLSINNIIAITRMSSLLGIVAIGETLVLLVGGIDLSIGSVVGFGGVLSAYLISNVGLNTPIVIFITIIFGLLVGLFNGLIVTKIGVTDFIVTLASMTIIHGMIYALQKGNAIYIQRDSFTILGKGEIGNITYSIIIMLVLFILFYIILTRTSYGRHIYAVGGNTIASRLSGIRIDRIKISAYVICSILSALVGMLIAARMSSGHASSGEGFLFNTITAVVLGGISLAGGMGTMVGTFIGVIIISSLSNGLAMFGIPYYYQEMIKGIILIAAVSFSAYRLTRRKGI